jgi:hypothetical protein
MRDVRFRTKRVLSKTEELKGKVLGRPAYIVTLVVLCIAM